jgi:hypothetical protein
MNHEGREDFVFYLIGETDQVNHHALTGNNLLSLDVIAHSLYAVFHQNHVPIGQESRFHAACQF